MRLRSGLICAALVISCLAATAKNKKKNLLPADIVQARTAWVVVDPQAGVDPKNPNANNLARGAVENALAKWGRLQPVVDPSQADLIIVVRKGSGKTVDSTIGGTPINAPPPAIGQRTDSGINGSARTGPPMFGGQESPMQAGPHPQMEVADPEDNFAVYRCNRMQDTGNPLNAPAVWRYSAPNALSAPDVPAVEVFRKLVMESEKQLSNSKP
jgi:hypothetical protein